MIKEPLSELHLAAWRAFLKAHATVVDRINHDLVAKQRLPLSSYDVLIELYEAPDRRLRMHELAQRVVLSRSGLTRLVDRLEAEGLLTRDRSGTDRRGVCSDYRARGCRFAQGVARLCTRNFPILCSVAHAGRSTDPCNGSRTPFTGHS